MAASTTDLQHLRVDQVGSLLRPAALKEAFDSFADEAISEAALVAAQDEAIERVVRLQEEHDLPVITDGEYRRRFFFDNFFDVAGLEEWARKWNELVASMTGANAPAADSGSGLVLAPSNPVTGRLRLLRNRPLEEFVSVQAMTERPAKASVLCADRLGTDFQIAGAHDVYSDVDEFLADVVAVQREIVSGLVAAGCRYVQIDAPSYTEYVDEPSLEAIRNRGEDPLEALERGIQAENAVIEGIEGAVFGIHICRGNAQSNWHREGAYEAIAERLFGGLTHQRLLLEYDDERAGDFKPLRFVPKGKIAVLGLITTKTGELESADDLKRRIDEAARYLPLEQLALSPQCGFATVMEGNVLSEDDQWRKLDLMLEVARELWG